ncbi:MAG: YidC/Oxa1 family insertase periplasmic-domain containing protein, partial [Phycisphaerales bacterium JB041]
MPGRPNKPLRLILPIALFLIGLSVPIAVVINTTSKSNSAKANRPAAPTEQANGQPAEPAAGQATEQAAADNAANDDGATEQSQPDPALSSAETAGRPEADATEAQPAAAVAPGAFVVEGFANDPLATDFAPLGELGLDSPFAMRVEFSHLGAGIKAIRLADEFDSVQTDRAAREGPVEPEKHVAVQEQVGNDRFMLVPFWALGVEINGTLVPMVIADGNLPAWRQVDADTPGRFEGFLLDSDGARAFRVEREYVLRPGSHDIVVRQRVENLTGTAYSIRWRQFGMVEMFSDSGYGGDKRRVRFGYLYDARSDPSRQFVDATKFLWNRNKLTGEKSEKRYPDGQIWTNTYSEEQDLTLVWSGVTNRYFGAVAHPLIDPADPAAALDCATVERVDRVLLENPDAMVLSYHTPLSTIEPGATNAYDMGLYAGPLNKSVIRRETMLSRLGIDKIVVYNFGGMCAFCTFTWLTGPLLGLLRFLHSVTSDWALAIILLVVCVRTILHPITRWS